MLLHLGLAGAVGAVQHPGRQPAHAAQAGRLGLGEQEGVQAVFVMTAGCVGGGAAASGAQQPEVLALQGLTPGPIGPAEAQHLVHPELEQGGHAVPVQRVQPDQQARLGQGLLLGLHIDVVVGIEGIEVAGLQMAGAVGGGAGRLQQLLTDMGLGQIGVGTQEEDVGHGR